MRRFPVKVWLLVRETYKTYQEHDPVLYAAAIAFFTVFSLPSALIIIVRVLGLVSDSGERDVKNKISSQVEDMVGTTSAGEVKHIIDTRLMDVSNPFLNFVGIVLLLFSATVIFTFLQKAINAIWDIKPKPAQGIGISRFLRDKVLSLVIIIVLGVLMLFSLTLDALVNVFTGKLDQLMEATSSSVNLVNGLNQLVSLSLVSFIFAIIFKFLPDAKIMWRDVAIGALMTGILFFAGKFVISQLLSNTNISTTYGAAGSLAGLLVWVFYSSVLVLVGASFTKVYTIQSGRGIMPKRDSIEIEVREVEKED